MKFYWTIFGLLGIEREDGRVWVTDGNEEGTVDDSEIIAVFKPKEANNSQTLV